MTEQEKVDRLSKAMVRLSESLLAESDISELSEIPVESLAAHLDSVSQMIVELTGY